MADPRMSQLLPTIRCGTCGRDVAYRELGTHLCEEAPAMPELPFLLSNKIKENVVKSDQPPPSPNDIQSPKSLPGDGYDSGYNSRVASSGSFADKMDQDFDRSRPSLRISTVNVSSGFLEKYGRFTSQTPDVDESEYEDDDLQSVDERTVRSQEITRNVSLDIDRFNNRNTDRDEDRAGFSPRSEQSINDLDGSPDRDDFSPRYEQSNTAEIVQPNSDDDTASCYSHRSARSEASRPKPRTYASRPVYGGRERFISEETFDECNDDTHSVSHSVRSSPDRRRSMRSSNGSSSAQEYIERKYGISPPTGKEGQPLPPPKLDTSTQDDPAARSGSTPFSKFLQNLFSPNSPTKQVEKTSPNDDFEDKVANLSNGMESMGITFQMPVLIKPRDADGTITEKTKCGSCQRQIFASEKYLEAIGLTFHRSCFRCDQCDVPIDHKSNFLHVNGEVLCQLTCGPAALEAAGANLPAKDCAERVPERTEYKRDELHCHDCHEPITDRPVYAMRNPYHEGHLRCKCCRSPIQPSVGHVEHEGNVYCPSDFAQLFLPKCNTCEKPIEGEAVCALDQKWHPECFGCQVCGDLFPNKSFYVFDNKPLCRRHYHKQNNSLCRTCDEPIEGPCAQVQPDNQSSGKRMDRYHPPCFSCTECRRPLNDIYYNFGGNPYCERHIMEIQRKKNIRVERRRTVFSVLPPGY